MSSLPRDAAERVLRMAIERQSRRGEHLSEREIHDIARQVGIEPEHVQAALAVERAREAALQRTAVENAVHEASGPKGVVWLGMAVFLGLVSVVGSIALIPAMILVFREADSAFGYIPLLTMGLLWLTIVAPFVVVAVGGAREYRRRRAR
jgi:hypothetical protein